MNNQISQRDIITALLTVFKVSFYDFEEVQGVTVTTYKFRPKLGTRVSRIRALKDELSSALQVQAVRIIAPMDDGSVGIEVPKRDRPTLYFSEITESEAFKDTDMELPVCIGQKVDGTTFVADLTTMPHLLVAGATGQGKSVLLNTAILSLVQKLTPAQLKLMLIDPKQVELGIYEPLENSYLACPVITDQEQARWKLLSACTLMEQRYRLLAEAGARNIADYNATITGKQNSKRLPYLVIIIDEYADLIMTSGKELERTICRLAQKARAVGIHLIISTQRPDTKIVTGNIKANFPTRIALRTTTGVDSRVILDRTGAEQLTGQGDMLFFNGASMTRIQGAYTATDNVTDICTQLAHKYEDFSDSFALPVSREEEQEKKWLEYHRQRMEEIDREIEASQRRYEEAKSGKAFAVA